VKAMMAVNAKGLWQIIGTTPLGAWDRRL